MQNKTTLMSSRGKQLPPPVPLSNVQARQLTAHDSHHSCHVCGQHCLLQQRQVCLAQLLHYCWLLCKRNASCVQAKHTAVLLAPWEEVARLHPVLPDLSNYSTRSRLADLLGQQRNPRAGCLNPPASPLQAVGGWHPVRRSIGDLLHCGRNWL